MEAKFTVNFASCNNTLDSQLVRQSTPTLEWGAAFAPVAPLIFPVELV